MAVKFFYSSNLHHCMRLLEYKGKDLLYKYGVEKPRGIVISSPDQVDAGLKYPVFVKAQVPFAGRAKMGLVKKANNIDEAKAISKEYLGRVIQDFPIKKVLLEEGSPIKKEYYISMTVDRTNERYLILASPEGGIDIEEVAKEHPEKIFRGGFHPFAGLRDYLVNDLTKFMGISGPQAKSFAAVVYAMYRVMMDYDAELVEINPLALTEDGRFIAIDVKIMVDDNALFRHNDINVEEEGDLTREELEARAAGFHYVELPGDIGIIGNGAGLTMATMDLVKEYGGEPADFLDIGGGASRDIVKSALTLLLKDARIKAILMNIFGGITRGDEVAYGVIEAIKEIGVSKPIFIRLKGTNEEEGRKILAPLNIKIYDTAEDAVQDLIKAVRGGR
jgi:succinyl-CoA synthetase beta subunit